MEDPVPQVPATRICIVCNKQFKSKSAGHRVCVKCTGNYNKASQKHVNIIVIVTEDRQCN